MKKTVRIVSNLLSIFLFCFILLLAYFSISSRIYGGEPKMFGYEIKTVLSGSMEPVFHTGSVIAIEPIKNGISFKPGEVITFKLKNGTLVTHRIVEITETSGQAVYKTKGDANYAADQGIVLPQNIIGKYTGFTIPYVGYVASFASSKTGSALFLISAGIALLLYASISIIVGIRGMNASTNHSDEGHST